MGYRTNRTFHCEDARADEVKRALVAEHGLGLELSPFSEDILWNDGDGCKWYDCRKHCESVAKRFPDVMFAIRGEGEDSGDEWVRVYRGEQVLSSDYSRAIAAIPRDEWRSTFLVPDGEVLP